ncbi:MAG: threonine synthase [Planctomycetes bacterium]|nr:threonine synthase [Planctomycetota bacterium]
MPCTAHFACFSGCPETYPLNTVVYRCARCGGLLDVIHDLKALCDRSPAAWMRLFEERYMRTGWPYGSGVWGKKEWVCPNVADENVVSLFEGGTNLFWAERLGKILAVNDLWVKQCGTSHTGSFKDVGMTVLVSMVKQMRAEGKDVRAIACASTGDTSAALAAYGAVAGIPTVVFLPKGRVTDAQLMQPIANGAITVALDTDFDGCMKLVQQVCEKHRLYLANSMNPLRIEGQKTISIEIVQQFDWEVPDWVIVPSGNMGNISAIGKGFLMMQALGLTTRLPRLVAAQAANASPLVESFRQGFATFTPTRAQPTAASAIQIGDPVNVPKAIAALKRFGGIVESATEDELADAAALGDRTGLLACPHTGVALAVLRKLIASGHVKPDDRVIVVSTAHGLKFMDFKRAYHSGSLPGVTPEHANRVVECPAVLGDVERALMPRLDLAK